MVPGVLHRFQFGATSANPTTSLEIADLSWNEYIKGDVGSVSQISDDIELTDLDLYDGSDMYQSYELQDLLLWAI